MYAQLQLKGYLLQLPESDAKGYISKLIKPSRQWKVTKTAKDCTIPGAIVDFHDLPEDEL